MIEFMIFYTVIAITFGLFTFPRSRNSDFERIEEHVLKETGEKIKYTEFDKWTIPLFVCFFWPITLAVIIYQKVVGHV